VKIGKTTAKSSFEIVRGGTDLISEDLADIQEVWSEALERALKSA
jgi:hypothetical protein